MENFIGVYENALSEELCGKVIDWFENNPHISGDGKVADGMVDKEVKDSTDAPLTFNSGVEVSNIIASALVESLKKYKKKYSVLDRCVPPWSYADGYNIQKYNPGGAYFIEHCENDHKESPRILAWMLYLNTVDDGGGTKFTTYDLTVKAEVGKILIWPAYWTHMHKGIVSPTQTKYIATGWYEFI